MAIIKILLKVISSGDLERKKWFDWRVFFRSFRCLKFFPVIIHFQNCICFLGVKVFVEVHLHGGNILLLSYWNASGNLPKQILACVHLLNCFGLLLWVNIYIDLCVLYILKECYSVDFMKKSQQRYIGKIRIYYFISRLIFISLAYITVWWNHGDFLFL